MSRYAKAVWAALSSFVASMLVALESLQAAGVNNPGLGDLSTTAWFTVAASVLAVTGGVFGFKNSEQ